MNIYTTERGVFKSPNLRDVIYEWNQLNLEFFQGHDRSRRSSLSSRAGSVEQAETGSRVSQDSFVTSQSTIEPKLRTEPVVPKQAKELGRIRFQIQLKLVTDTSLCTLQVSGVTRGRGCECMWWSLSNTSCVLSSLHNIIQRQKWSYIYCEVC